MTAARGASERGFALILAILALTLLTVLGLSIAATTSMDVQVAANHRWSQQAFYNAEGALEVGRKALRGMSWGTVLPAARTTPWLPTDAHNPPVPPFTRAARNFESGGCDGMGSGTGRGVVLDDGTSPAPWEDVSRLLGNDVRGTVTLWIRRPLRQHTDGTFSDDPSNDVLILTAEGLAPVTAGALTSRSRAISARRLLEVQLKRIPTASGWDVVVERVWPGSTVCS